MTSVRFCVALFALAATSASAEDDNPKMAAVNKVVELLEDLQTKVMAEGEREAETYNTFACFCKDTSTEKQEAIKEGEDNKDSLTSNIETLSEDRDKLDEQITLLETEIAEAEKEMADATKERKGKLQVYTKNEADVSGAIDALTGAIKALKGSKSASLVQLQAVSKTLKHAAAMADALGFGGPEVQQAVASFLQQPEVPMQDYDFHSDKIIDMLEKLMKDFRESKNTLDADEVKSVQEYDMFMEEKTNYVKRKNADLEKAQETKSEKVAQISEDSQELTTTSAQLLDDQEYLKQLTEICSAKAKTWDQRSKCRQDELSALTAAIEIVKGTVSEKTSKATIRFAQEGVVVELAHRVAHNDAAMEAIEATAEAADDNAPLGFLQRGMGKPRALVSALATKVQPKDGGRQAVIDLLNSQGKKLKSTLLTSLANQISVDHFAKIKKLISELIEKLLAEAANEANQKGWCDKAIGDAEQKRGYAAEKIAELNAQMAELEATRDKLGEELSVLSKEIAELTAAQEKAEKERAAEKAENEETIEEAKAGQEAVEKAMDILDKFYKTAAKGTVELQRGPLDDMPDAGFDAGEAYTGAGDAAGGIIGMMDVIRSDFVRTLVETEKAEDEAADDHMKFMTETGVSLEEKKMAEEQKTKYKDDAESKLESATTDMDQQTELLTTNIKELIELQPACVDTGMSYEERVARREQEIESLKKALCILTAFAEYGPEGAGDKC